MMFGWRTETLSTRVNVLPKPRNGLSAFAIAGMQGFRVNDFAVDAVRST